jgi:hypothetical protein
MSYVHNRFRPIGEGGTKFAHCLMAYRSVHPVDYGALVAQRDRNQYRLERQVAQFEEDARNAGDDLASLDALYHRLMQTRQRVKQLQAQLAGEAPPQHH